MTDTSADSFDFRPGPGPVRRVLVRWDGRRWMISSEHRVPSMTLPAPDPLPAGSASRGFWIELVGRDGRVRYRQVIADPLAGMEQFDEEGEITRLSHPPHDVAVELLIPDVADSELHLVSNPVASDGDARARPSRSILYLSAKPDDPGKGEPPHHHRHDH